MPPPVDPQVVAAEAEALFLGGEGLEEKCQELIDAVYPITRALTFNVTATTAIVVLAGKQPLESAIEYVKLADIYQP